jgi:diphthamide biosynthesis enzyme Dph1/Dph2-like protein
MEKMHLEVRKKFDFDKIDFGLLDGFEGSVSLGATIQYLELMEKVKEYLENRGVKVIIKKGPVYDGQVLGCNPMALDASLDNILLVTDGKFHAYNNAIKIKKEISVFNGESLEKVTQKEIDKELAKIKGKQSKFLMETVVGLLVTTKEGQHYPNFEKLKKQIEEKGKKVFVFVGDSLSSNELDNFPEIKVWVNTGCYGIGFDDNRIVSLYDLEEFL